ncbi:MAG TPA: glycoside hydrolase family 97 catalytic domain-containing protein [Opitutaceae bacterium]|nr:glycoside hydrolase family 97 catalytic domain-containing protein [Opitutaceae bacterium]
MKSLLSATAVSIFLGLFGVLCLSAHAAEQLSSPNGRVALTFRLLDDGAPVYAIAYRAHPIVDESRLGFPEFSTGFRVTKTELTEHHGEWTQVYGERKVVPDNYRELRVELQHASGKRLCLVFRAYDEGAAFRYEFPEQETKSFFFTGELTEFRFPPRTFGYEEHGTEGDYRRADTKDFQPECERPLTLEYESGIFAALGEAANLAYPRMLLSPLPGVSGALVTALGGTSSNLARKAEFRQRNDPSVKLAAGGATPWRMFIVGDKPGDLLERNYLMLNLNAPNALADTSWIKPGKAMRDAKLTTENSKAIIDFAATAGLSYVHLDWKWYGPVEYEAAGETKVRAPDLDIPEIIRYGRAKGVGLILYVDRRQVKRERERIFKMFEDWGVAGVKIGFVDVGPQTESAWITKTIEKAAEHKLMLNIHDGWRSTGLSRTWPNLMTLEGIQGNEHFPTAEHNCTLPFTRYVGGAGDYTVCYYDERLKVTHAHQLAMHVISYSPLQWLFWYDLPSYYRGEPEVEFFRVTPTTWDETKVLQGEIGKFAMLARRSGRDWFVGTINAGQTRTLRMSLDFLEPRARYVAHLYADDESVPTATKVSVTTREVDAGSSLEITLRANGGHAVWLERK